MVTDMATVMVTVTAMVKDTAMAATVIMAMVRIKAANTRPVRIEAYEDM
jgi:hypothetical protein